MKSLLFQKEEWIENILKQNEIKVVYIISDWNPN